MRTSNPLPPPTSTATSPSKSSNGVKEPPDGTLTLDVEPRKPRLAWQGMDRREVAVSVPTQVVEIVRPGKAQAGDDLLPGVTAGIQKTRSEELPPNRLIWTNDNLVALQTLLDERDPVTRDHRNRGKVDLIYIDPPFMVQNDFLGENAVEVELDAEIEAKKEPSLVEILAYRDTWRQGLDSFLSMLRSRLVLLKELLAPSGSLFIHLDWHAVHYVKVLMDELFGYESLVNEIVWQRQTSHNDLAQGAKHLGRVHDTILVYQHAAEPFLAPAYTPYDPAYVRSHYNQTDEQGRRFQYGDLSGPGGAAKGNPYYEVMGHLKHWRFKEEKMRQLIAEGRVVQPTPGAVPRHKRFLDDMPGIPLQDVWADVNPINSQAKEALGYPTQKPVALLERIIRLACPSGGLVLDCFAGSGTTAEAAERLGRRWICIDNGKFAVHLSRKRLIQLHGQPKPAERVAVEYVECEKCKSIERKEKPQKAKGGFDVRPFSVENVGVYQRAEAWQDFQTQRTKYRDEMIKVFGGEVTSHSPLLHGRKGASWVHVGPLDGPVSSTQVWSIAREAQRTDRKSVTVLSADFDTLSTSEKEEIKKVTGVTMTIRIIPASAIDEVRRRLELARVNPEMPIESMAIPAFYAPLSILLSSKVSGRMASVTLDRCEIDIESFLASQRPVLKPITDGMTPVAKKKAKAEIEKWDARQKELEKWLAKATSWQKFIDFWAVDWDYGRRVGADGKPIFETDWQSFRVRKGKETEPLVLTAEYKYQEAGHYRVAARVTDVFGNDGIAAVVVEVR